MSPSSRNRNRNRSGHSARAASLVLLLAVAGSGALPAARAQTPLPPSIDPSRIEQRFEPAPAPPRKAELPEFHGASPELPAGAMAGIRFKLKEIRIEGVKVLPLGPWRKQASRNIGHEITGKDVFELARSLTEAYRAAGYILSQVVVPPQSLADGVLTLRAVEGYVAEVHVRGAPAAHDMLVRIGERIKASRPLRDVDLERYLLIANDLPGIHLRSVLAPSRTPGAADLTLIAEVDRAQGYVSLDNYGSRYLGPEQLTARATANQLFRAGDALRLTAVGARGSELAFWQLAYSQILDADGLKLVASLSRARTEPGYTLQTFDVLGTARSATLALAYPLVRTRARSLFARAAFDYRNVETDVLGTHVIEDRIRALRLGATWLAIDSLEGRNTLDLELGQGLDGTDRNDPLKSRVGAKGKFTKLSFDYQRLQPLGGRFGFTTELGGQWANEPLLSSEQYALGGRRFGRAYEPVELVGDRALAFRVEPAYTRPMQGGAGTLQLYAFYDVGSVWHVSDGAPVTRDSLASAGFGTRAFLSSGVTAAIEAAWPLTRPVASYQAQGDGYRARVLASISARF